MEIKLGKRFQLTMKYLLRNMDRILTMKFQEVGHLMALKSLENDVQKMITGEEISIVNIVTNSTFHIPLFTLISNKSIAEGQMVK